MSRKSISLIVLSATFLVFAIVAIIYLFSPWIGTRSLLAQVGGLQVGKSTFADATNIAARIRAIPSDQCTPADCSWHAQVTNWSMPEVWRGRGAVFSAGFHVHDSLVIERGFSYQIDTGPTVPYVSVEEKLHWRGNTTEPVFVSTLYTAQEPYYQANIRLTPAAPQDVRDRYFSFNLKCLWWYGGCRNAKEMLPTLDWKR